MYISAIVCQSQVEGFIFVNGFSMGPCSLDSSISIPWDGHTPLLISFTPHGGNYLTTSLAFTSLENLPSCENTILTVWSGVVEVQFMPKKSIVYPPPLLPHELKKITFTYKDIEYTASLIDYCGTWVIVENEEKTLLCKYLSEKIDGCSLVKHYDDPVLLHINIQDYHWVITNENGEFSLCTLGQHKYKKIGNMLTFTASTQYAPVNIDYQNEDGKINVNRYIKSHNNRSNLDIAIDMLSSVMTGNIDYAYSLLATSLQRAFTPQQIVDFIGPIDHIDAAKYYYDAVDTAIAVVSKNKDNVYSAVSYGFEFDSMGKISNIAPL